MAAEQNGGSARCGDVAIGGRGRIAGWARLPLAAAARRAGQPSGAGTASMAEMYPGADVPVVAGQGSSRSHASSAARS